jgi:hypothetical protein
MEEVEAVVGGHLLYISYILTNEESHVTSTVGKCPSDLHKAGMVAYKM